MHLACAWYKYGFITAGVPCRLAFTNKACHTSGCSLGRLGFNTTELHIGFVTVKVAMKIFLYNIMTK